MAQWLTALLADVMTKAVEIKKAARVIFLILSLFGFGITGDIWVAEFSLVSLNESLFGLFSMGLFLFLETMCRQLVNLDL